MKKKMPLFLMANLVIALSLSCKKSDTPSVKDCETNNYGVVTVNFGSTSVIHSIIITYSNSSFREKLVGIGKSTDTIHLAPGFYPASIASVNNLGQVLTQITKNLAATKCSEETIPVAF
jgi:hypothetical protein